MKDKIYVNDNMFKHGLFIANPNPIARVSKFMEWDFNSPEWDDDQTIVYTDNTLYDYRPDSDNNIAWLIESPEYHKAHYEWIKYNYHHFKRVLTHDKELLSVSDVFKFTPLGGCWLYDEDIGLHEKTKMFSMIASWKRDTSGHKLRHIIANGSSNRVDLYGSGYNPIEKKITGLKDYMYTFCIENCRKDYYFTEKLIDSFLTGTVPIYWGCPSIGDFFNLDGMIVFEDLSELKDKLKNCTKDFYQERMDAIQDNFNRAKKYMIPEDFLYENNKSFLY